MGNRTLYEDTATVSAENVTVERHLLCKEAGIAGTITIRSERDEPVMVHVVDEIPGDLPVDDVAFKPGDEPDIGDASPERISIRHTVADEPERINYGIFPSGSVSEVRWRSPAIQDISVAEHVQPEGDRSVGDTTGETDSDKLFSRLQNTFDQTVLASDADSDRPTDADSGDRFDTPMETLTGGADQLDDVDAPDVETEIAEAETTDSETRTEIADAEAAGPEGSDTGTENARRREERDSNGQAGSGVEDEGGRGRSGAGREVPRSVEVRLDRLSAQVEEFAAYATALEGLIDEHGTGTEVVDRLESDIDDLEARLGALDDDVAAVRDTGRELERVDDEVDHIGDEVDDHAAELDAARGDIDELDDRVDEFGDDLASLTETVDTVEEEISTVRADVAEMREEVETIHDEVASLKSFRRSLAELSSVGDE